MKNIARLANTILMPSRLVDLVIEIVHIHSILRADALGGTAARPDHPDRPRGLRLRSLDQNWRQ